MAVKLFDNFPVWLWAQKSISFIAMAYRWKFFLWKSFEMFLTIFLYGFELFWQFYCMAMTLQIYQQNVWQCSCAVFWQFSGSPGRVNQMPRGWVGLKDLILPNLNPNWRPWSKTDWNSTIIIALTQPLLSLKNPLEASCIAFLLQIIHYCMLHICIVV